MKIEELKDVLRHLKVETEMLKPYQNGQLQIPCPLAPWFHQSKKDAHPSLSIKPGDELHWTVWKCWTCKEAGKLWQLFDSYGELGNDEEVKKLSLYLLEHDKPSLSMRFKTMQDGFDDWIKPPKPAEIKLDESILDNFEYLVESPRAMRYVTGRGIEEDVAIKFDLRYDPRQQRIVCPVRDREGGIVGAVGRTIVDDPRRYYNYFNMQAGKTLGGLHLLRGYPRLLIVEGFFDLLNCYNWCDDIHCDAVCTWRAETSLDQINLILLLDKTVFVCYDLDRAGESGWRKVRKLLEGRTYGVRRLKMPDNVDVGAMTEKQFQEMWSER